MLQGTRSIYKNQLYFYILVKNNLNFKIAISFTIASKNVKYLGINLIKHVQIYALKTIKHCREKLEKTN